MMKHLIVIMKDGEVLNTKVPMNFTVSEIYGYLNDKFSGWEDYEEV